MPKARLIVTAVVVGERSQAEVARARTVSKGWVSKLLSPLPCRRRGGLRAAVQAAKTSPTALGTRPSN
ncbi:hypothetical protein [Streptomyces winkii]|uniref:hypothetical protein n=1 Tax=Streptomyces winkii TaxID=3051178 RepID=UPI0028D4AEB3|nr:hypothetical protein [Streptomyces sp. DSM 40971]